IPPFQTPDEPAHFFHSYAVSEGRLRAVRGVDRVGDVLPASLGVVAYGLLDDVPFHPERRVDPARVRVALEVPLAPERRDFLDFPGSALTSFVPYLPQAAGALAGRLVGAPPLVLLYLMRLANLLVSTLVIVLAIRLAPGLRWFAAAVALTPMSLCVRSSASADGLTIAAAFLLAALAARLAWGEGEVRWRDWALLLGSSVLTCLTKAAYFPLMLVALIVPRQRFPWRRRGAVLLVHFLLSGLATAYALDVTRLVDVSLRPGTAVDADRQIRDALAEPWRFAAVVSADYVRHAPRYVAQFVGKLGWADVALPTAFLLAYAALVAALLVLDTSPRIRVKPWQRGALAAAVLLVMGLISASQYAVWTPYRADYIDGIQGRYFLPIATAGAWLLHVARLGETVPNERLGLGLAVASAVSLAVTVTTVWVRYYG
ncbi:MAG TPA: DUF2142 domain-containing protein, partial [Thermoanaerobaculia bacterium]|nr:DUF2142 domain-containing protein [Thermoanaerobaculia bacterium]